MKQNYKMTISYDGTRFYGWEHQPDKEMTIQGKMETVLSRMVDAKVEVIGCGRTDAGVHAKAMVCNAHLDTDMSEKAIKDYLNQYLPEDIAVLDVRIASERFHARYNAKGKTYCYTCYMGDEKPIFNRKYVYYLEGRVDIEAMKKAASYMVGEHDFASFCSNPRMKKSTVRTIDKIEITKTGDFLKMTFHGTGFLQHQVRIMSGTLIEVGYGDRDAESIPGLIAAKKRDHAGFTAPPKGLCMIKVDY